MFPVLAFGAILSPSDTVPVGKESVFTYAHGKIFEFNSDDWVRANLRDRMSNYGNVVTADRALFSDRYVIKVIPSVAVTLDDWINAFDASWVDMGYNNAILVMAETGSVSSQAGGVSEIIPDIGSTVGTTIGTTLTNTIKPLFPYLIIGIVAYAGILSLPQIIRSGKR